MNNSKDHIVVFDFDKTLTYKDTLIDFLSFCSDFRFIKIRYFISTVLKIISWIGLLSNDKLKDILVTIYIKGSSKDEVERKGEAFAKQIFFNKVFHEVYLKEHKNSGIIVSASFEELLKFIFPQNIVLASKLKYDRNNKVIGVSKNLYGINKVKELAKKKLFVVDVFYTDSFSDMPVCDIADKVYLVKGDNVTLFK